jgi:hypothetical protein
MNGLYTKRHLLQALKEAAKRYPNLKIGASYPALLKYERAGIIPKPTYQLRINGTDWRFYTKEEINDCVDKLVAFKSSIVK